MTGERGESLFPGVTHVAWAQEAETLTRSAVQVGEASKLLSLEVFISLAFGICQGHVGLALKFKFSPLHIKPCLTLVSLIREFHLLQFHSFVNIIWLYFFSSL